MSTLPVNYRKQNSEAAWIADRVDYALQVGNGYRGWMSAIPCLPGADAMRPLAGRRILELGPGPTLGASVLLACAGARVSVADRFLGVWDPEFHPVFFGELLQRVETLGTIDSEPIRAVIAAGSFAPALDCHERPAERVGEIDGCFDIVLSNAVLEHVEDLYETVRQVALKTAPGGRGFHQVDFRDHRNFDRPLEYLTLGEQAFEHLRREHACECGCAWRVSEVEAAFAQAGFRVETQVNMLASPEYLADVKPRLHPDFAGLTPQDLAGLSGFFVMSI